MTRILMVCLGNICRSPLAHGILQSKLSSDKFLVDSAGTGDYHIGNPPDARSITAARKKGIDISKQECRQFKVEDFEKFDIIYVMDQSNYSNVIQLARNEDERAKVKLLLEDYPNATTPEVPDPYWREAAEFDAVYEMLDEACTHISERLNN